MDVEFSTDTSLSDPLYWARGVERRGRCCRRCVDPRPALYLMYSLYKTCIYLLDQTKCKISYFRNFPKITPNFPNIIIIFKVLVVSGLFCFNGLRRRGLRLGPNLEIEVGGRGENYRIAMSSHTIYTHSQSALVSYKKRSFTANPQPQTLDRF